MHTICKAELYYKSEVRKPLESDETPSFTTTTSDSELDRDPMECPELFKLPSFWSFVKASAKTTCAK